MTAEYQYDAIIYIDHRDYSFVLQDLSILFGITAVEKHHFGGIWSFHKTEEDRIQQCLLSTLFVVNLHHVKQYNLDYEAMLREQSFCGDELRRPNDEVIVIGDSTMNGLEAMASKYGIMALPWWMVMDALEFTRYYWMKSAVEADDNDRYGLRSWTQFSKQFELQRHRQPISLIVQSRDMNRMQSSLFWKKWLSIRQEPVEFCLQIP